MREVLWRLRKDDRFNVLKLNREHLKRETDDVVVTVAQMIARDLALDNVAVERSKDFSDLFRRGVLHKPLILIMDEFDALTPTALGSIVSVFRNIYIHCQDQLDRPAEDRDYWLHSVALIGVRALLLYRGSPFNVQRSVHIPNLTAAEAGRR